MSFKEVGQGMSPAEQQRRAAMHPGEQWLGDFPMSQARTGTTVGRGRSVMNLPSAEDYATGLLESGNFASVRTIPAFRSDGSEVSTKRGVVVKYKQKSTQR